MAAASSAADGGADSHYRELKRKVARAVVPGLRSCGARAMTKARISGWFDPTATDAANAGGIHVREHSDRVEFSGPALGISLLASPDVRWHATATQLTVCLGTPRSRGVPVDPERLAGMLQQGDVAPDLQGRFAILHADVRQRTARLLNDRFGVLPWCHALEGSRLSFADRADCVPKLSAPQLAPQAIFNYIYFHVIPSTATVFTGVERLEPATELMLDAAGGIKRRTTWSPRFARHPRSRDGSLGERFRQVVQAAVERESVGHQIGAFLSGGTDSSTVAGMLCGVLGRGAPTFSIGFDAEGYDEMAYARIASRHFGTDHHEYYVTPADLCDGIPKVAAFYDQPFGNSSAVPAYYCARLARDKGITKLLAGDGGDELFGGNSRYAKQKVFEAYWSLPAALRRAVLEPLLDNAVMRRLPVIRKASSYVAQARVPMPARTETYNLLERFGTSNVLAPAFLEQVRTESPAALQAQVYSRFADASFVDRMLAFDWRFTLADNDLPKVTGTTALAGVRVGFPLLDDDLVDLSLQLGADDKVRGLQLRHFFKAALTEFLPPEIIAKKKHGFGLPVGPWLLRDAAFRGLARDSLDGLVDRAIIRPQLVDDLFSSRLQEHPGYYGEMVWILMMLEQWLRASAPTFRVR